MIQKWITLFLFVFFVIKTPVFAQDEDFHPNMDYKINKMKKELNLTESQADAMRPIVKDYLISVQSFWRGGRTGDC